jgi:hypothetical protein
VEDTSLIPAPKCLWRNFSLHPRSYGKKSPTLELQTDKMRCYRFIHENKNKKMLYKSEHALTFLIKICPRAHNTQLSNPNPCDRIHNIKSTAIYINCILQFQKLLHAHNTQLSISKSACFFRFLDRLY